MNILTKPRHILFVTRGFLDVKCVFFFFFFLISFSLSEKHFLLFPVVFQAIKPSLFPRIRNGRLTSPKLSIAIRPLFPKFRLKTIKSLAEILRNKSIIIKNLFFASSSSTNYQTSQREHIWLIRTLVDVYYTCLRKHISFLTN